MGTGWYLIMRRRQRDENNGRFVVWAVKASGNENDDV